MLRVKNFLILLLTGYLTACSEGSNNAILKETPEARAHKIADPLIAKETADLLFEVKVAQDTFLQPEQRIGHIWKLRDDYPDYLSEVTTPGYYSGKPNLSYYSYGVISDEGLNILMKGANSADFNKAVAAQEDLIKRKWMSYAAEQVYKQALQRKIEAEQELERVRSKEK